MRKILTLFLILLFSLAAPSFAAVNLISSAVSKTDLNKDSVISVSVKEVENSNSVYDKKTSLSLNPASTLKVFTMASVLHQLGDDYKLETSIYLDKNSDLYLKLSGDPLFKTEDLNALVKKLKLSYKGKIRYFYIDDTVIDNEAYPKGWTIDDFWPNAPMISPYMINNNTVDIQFSLIEGGKSILITQPSIYQFAFINKLIISDKTNIVPKLDYGDNSNIVTLEGTIKTDTRYELPVINPKTFYMTQLADSLNKNNILYGKQFYFKKVPSDARKIAVFSRPLKEVVSYTLEKSDNTCAETLFKVAAGNYAASKRQVSNSSLGTTQNGILMFNDYYKQMGLFMDKINIADASGVSRYNTLTTEWTTDALIYLLKDSNIKDYMVSPGDGTLSSRLLVLKDVLKAKTGTLYGISSLCGYLTSYGGKNYVFSIIIQNYDRRTSVIKGLEDDIVNAIWSL